MMQTQCDVFASPRQLNSLSLSITFSWTVINMESKTLSVFNSSVSSNFLDIIWAAGHRGTGRNKTIIVNKFKLWNAYLSSGGHFYQGIMGIYFSFSFTADDNFIFLILSQKQKFVACKNCPLFRPGRINCWRKKNNNDRNNERAKSYVLKTGFCPVGLF